MKKSLVVMAVFVMAAGLAVAANASDVPAWQRALEPENYAGYVDSGEISGPIGTGAVPAKVEQSRVKALDPGALRRSLEPENYAGYVDSGEISGPIETGAVPAKAESSKVKESDTDALMRSLEPENYVGHPDMK